MTIETLVLDTNTGAARHLEILRTNALSGELEHRLLVQDNTTNEKLDTLNTNLGAKLVTLNTDVGAKLVTLNTDVGAKLVTLNTDVVSGLDDIRNTIKSVNPTIYEAVNVISDPAAFTIDIIQPAIRNNSAAGFPSQLVDVSHLQHINIDYKDNFVLEDPNNFGDVLLDESKQTLPSNGTHTVEVVGRINSNYNAINAVDYTQPSYNAINPWHTLTGLDAGGATVQIINSEGNLEDINVVREVVLANFSPTPKLFFSENSHYLQGLDVSGINQIYFRTNAGSADLVIGGAGVLFDKLHTTQANDPRIDADPNFVPSVPDVEAYVLAQF